MRPAGGFGARPLCVAVKIRRTFDSVCPHRMGTLTGQPGMSRPAPSPVPMAPCTLLSGESVPKPVRLGPLTSLRDRLRPHPALFPLEKLARGAGTALRKPDPQQILHDLTPGNEELRRQIALRYVAHVTVAVNEIVLTSGALEALNLSLQAVTRPGDSVAIESPTFYGCLQALERLQLRAVEIATHPRHGLHLEALVTALDRQDVKACWFMPNLQNPLGASMPPEQKKAPVELVSRHRIPLIEDDVYAELHFGMRRPLPAKAFDREGWVLHSSSFSKSLAPGYRLGWVAAGRFASAGERLKLMSTISVAVPSQHGPDAT